MLKIILTTVQVFIGIYWAGAVARQNERVDAFFSLLEGSYAAFNRCLKDAELGSSLAVLRKFYGWLAVGLVLSLLLFARLVPPGSSLGLAWAVLFTGAFFAWFSLRWCLEHRSALKEYAPQTLLMVLTPLLAAGLDQLAGTQLVQVLIQPLVRSEHLQPFVSALDTPWAAAASFSVVLFACFVIMYGVTWLLSAPVAFASFLLVALPIWFARRIHSIDQKNTFFWFSVVVMLIVSWGLTRL
jgi:hypothetical protein